MTVNQEALESVAERARRALRDNDEARFQAQHVPREAQPQMMAPQHPARPPAPQSEVVPVQPQAEQAWHRPPEQGAAAGTLELLQRRMSAIHLVRELEPQRTCFRQRVQELSQRLAQTPTDSVHYAHLLQRLAEAHGELSQLEAQVEEGQHVIRSTEWLMELLSDPTRSWGRPAGREQNSVAR